MRLLWRVCVRLFFSLSARRIWYVPVHNSPPMPSCFHTSSTKDPLFLHTVLRSVFRWVEFKQSHLSPELVQKVLTEGLRWKYRPPQCPILSRVFLFSGGYTEGEVAHGTWLTNCFVCPTDAPRQDILETLVERAFPVYRERLCGSSCSLNVISKGSYQDKSSFFNLSALLDFWKVWGSLTKVGRDTDLFIFLHYSPFQMKWGRMGMMGISKIQTFRQQH